MSITNANIDLLDDDEIAEAFDNPGRPSQEGEEDEPATDKTDDTPTGEEDESAKEGEDDPALKAADLEFEVERLREESAKLTEAQKFLDDAKNAANPNELLQIFARHIGAEPQTGQRQTTTGQGWQTLDEVLEKVSPDGERFDDATKELMTGVKSGVESIVNPLLQKIAALEAKVGGIEPHFAKAKEQEESLQKQSSAEKRAGGVSGLVIQMSPGRNAGWAPTKEQIVAVAKANPDMFSGVTNAKDAAKALLEKVRIAHLDDILSHKNGTKPQANAGNRSPVPKNDARGADSSHDSRKAAIIERSRNGFS